MAHFLQNSLPLIWEVISSPDRRRSFLSNLFKTNLFKTSELSWSTIFERKKIRGEKKLFFQLSHFLIIFDGGPSPPYPPPNQCDQ